MAMTIDVISDVVCPWCYLGKYRLESALATLRGRDGFAAIVNWHPFQLDPSVPAAGVPRKPYIENKLGGAERVAAGHARLAELGRREGIAFDFERIAVQPNTLAAHRLVSWAQQRGDASDLVERLFAAFFTEGRDVGDHGVLADIAAAAGYAHQSALDALDGNEARVAVEAMIERIRKLGIGGVPFFILGERIALSGAQEPHVIADAINQAREAAEGAAAQRGEAVS